MKVQQIMVRFFKINMWWHYPSVPSCFALFYKNTYHFFCCGVQVTPYESIYPCTKNDVCQCLTYLYCFTCTYSVGMKDCLQANREDVVVKFVVPMYVCPIFYYINMHLPLFFDVHKQIMRIVLRYLFLLLCCVCQSVSYMHCCDMNKYIVYQQIIISYKSGVLCTKFHGCI